MTTEIGGDHFDPVVRMATMAEHPYRDDSVTERLAERLAKLLLPALIDGVLAAIRELPAPVAAPKAPVPRKLKATGIPDFDVFWDAYPKRCLRRDRPGALKAWIFHGPPLETVLAALQWQDSQPDWIKEGGAFIPAPAVWINQHRWEREQAVAVSPLEPATAPIVPASEPPRRRARLDNVAHWQNRVRAGDDPATWDNWDEMAARAIAD